MFLVRNCDPKLYYTPLSKFATLSQKLVFIVIIIIFVVVVFVLVIAANIVIVVVVCVVQAIGFSQTRR